MSIKTHALRMAKEAFRSRWRKHARSVTRSKYWTDRGHAGHPIEPYNKEKIKKLIRSVKHLDPRKVRLQKVKKPPGSRAPTISLVGKGWAGDVKSMQVPGITKLERRKLNKQIKASVKKYLKEQPKIAKMSVKDRKRKYGFEDGGPVKLLRGALLTKGIRKGFKIFKKESPQLFSKMKRSRLQLKADTKKIKTPELIPLGISKIKPDDLRKLTIAQGVKIKVKNQAKIALLHNRKAMPLLWSKAKSLKQVYKLDKYNKPNTQIKIDKFFKEHTKLEKYIDKIKSKSATKHSHGGEVTIGNNVDRSLL